MTPEGRPSLLSLQATCGHRDCGRAIASVKVIHRPRTENSSRDKNRNSPSSAPQVTLGPSANAAVTITCHVSDELTVLWSSDTSSAGSLTLEPFVRKGEPMPDPTLWFEATCLTVVANFLTHKTEKMLHKSYTFHVVMENMQAWVPESSCAG